MGWARIDPRALYFYSISVCKKVGNAWHPSLLSATDSRIQLYEELLFSD